MERGDLLVLADCLGPLVSIDRLAVDEFSRGAILAAVP